MNLLFVLLMLGVAVTNVVVFQTIGKSLIQTENYRFIEQKGRTIVALLSQRISYAEAMAKSMATVAEELPRDESLFKKMIPKLLYDKASRITVAGGGIWPAPYAFDERKERRSFFWGHDGRNRIAYFDDYNHPDSPGYHAEEWYVPARYLKRNQTYWSKSYVDPYSHEPMVTCTAPYYRGDVFSGVSTVDLKLDDLKTFLDEEAGALQGYIFAVDRNNKFLSFPDTGIVKAHADDATPSGFNAFLHAGELADKDPRFLGVATALEKINTDILNMQTGETGREKKLAGMIARDSYQITTGEARLITATLDVAKEDFFAKQYAHIPMGTDLILNEPASAFIFPVPRTYWKIVIVSPDRQVNRVADSISQQIFILLSIGILVCVCIAYLYIRSIFVQPLAQMTRQLIKATEGKGKGLIHLAGNKKNELGNLAYWFNLRTEELKESNARLEREIKSRKASEKALKESEQRLYIHLKNTPVGAISWDLKFRVTEWNPSAEKIFGFTKEEALGKHSTELILPEDVKPSVDRIFSELVLGKGGQRSVNENLTKDGRRIVCDWYNTTLRDTEGQVTGVASLVNDITDRRRTQELIIQSEKMMSVGGLAAGMAHELNNPLAGMIQNAQIIHNRLTKKLPANVDAASQLGVSMDIIERFMENRGILKQLEHIRGAGVRAAKIIDNMLSFAKKSVSDRVETDLAALIEDTVALTENDYNLSKKYDFKHIEIIRKFDANVPAVFCERTKIQQVIFNILKNASEAISGDGTKGQFPRIVLRLYVRGPMACIEIEDNGPGIDAGTRKRIFEPFYTTKSPDKGTGLGLSVSYFIVVDNHGGEMAVESVPGQGAKFIIKLPFQT